MNPKSQDVLGNIRQLLAEGLSPSQVARKLEYSIAQIAEVMSEAAGHAYFHYTKPQPKMR
jgi:hypothetical protein